MKPGSTMRVARPTDNLAAIAKMYAKGLGFDVLAEFEDHRGFDGVILGHPKQPYHMSSPLNEDAKSAKLQRGITCWSSTFPTKTIGKQAVSK
jgi:hypothetical protein